MTWRNPGCPYCGYKVPEDAAIELCNEGTFEQKCPSCGNTYKVRSYTEVHVEVWEKEEVQTSQ